ncbi:MAG: rane-flanked domain protein [Nevskia sp.]|nr:rane-flanked domain protein [Nevskia sp.]
MSYVEKNLLPGETIVHKGRVHWIVYGKSIGLIIVGLLLMYPWSQDAGFSKLWIFGAVALLLAVVVAIPAAIRALTTELVVTSRRVVAKRGIVRRDTFEMLHRRVESISVHQSIAGRLLGYGTLELHGTGGGLETIPTVADPLGFRNAAMAQSDAA